MSYYERKFPDWKEKVLSASASTQSARKAAELLCIKYDTYKKYAIKYGCFDTNQSCVGISKGSRKDKIPLEEIIFEGKHPQYQSNKLRKRLLEEKYFEYKCYSCGLTEWLGNPIPLELDHINGNPYDNEFSNLNILCPNCHAFTSTYRGKNSRKV